MKAVELQLLLCMICSRCLCKDMWCRAGQYYTNGRGEHGRGDVHGYRALQADVEIGVGETFLVRLRVIALHVQVGGASGRVKNS